MSFYLWIILATLSGPLLLSFDKKVAFYRQFKFLIPSLLAVALPFLVWDAYFTKEKIWGFTPDYLAGIYLGNLPLEECLFFLVVPFACVFIHEVHKAYFPEYKGVKLAHYFAFGFTLSAFAFGVLNLDKSYTSTACILAAFLTIGFYYVSKAVWYRHFVLTYLLALIPFLIVNGILTGAITENPLVWYNENHIMGIRIYTIPLEDLFYNYALLLPTVGIYEYLKRKTNQAIDPGQKS